MKNLFLSLFTVSCFLPFFLSAQSLDWKNAISAPAITPFGPSAEFKSTAFGPDGRVYSTGYFLGNRAQIGNVILKADSLGYWSQHSDSLSVDLVPATIFVACHEANGSLAWAKAISSADADYWVTHQNEFGFLSGDKLTFDDQGNLIMAGFYIGDTLMYDGVPFESNPSDPFNYTMRVVVVKISPDGTLLWGHSDKILTNGTWLSRVKNLRFQSGIIEAMVLSGSMVPNEKYTIVRYSNSGTKLSALPYSPQFPGNENSWLSSRCTLPDGRHLFSSLLTSDRSCIVSLLNADYSPISHNKLSLYSPNLTPTSTKRILASSIQTTPDGQISLMLVPLIEEGITDWKLIMDTDTLDLPNFHLLPFKTLMIRMSEPGCMKKVEILDFTNLGHNDMSPNGNWVMLRDNYWGYGDSLIAIKQVDRNGATLQTLPLGNIGFSKVLQEEGVFDPSSTVHSLHWKNGGVAGCYGSWLFKASFPDPVVADQSFSGCLSNRTLLLANEETLRPEPVARVFESQPGNWEIQGLPVNGARYQLMSAQGQTLLSGSTNSETARFKTASLPAGVYYLRINDDKGLSRIMRLATIH